MLELPSGRRSPGKRSHAYTAADDEYIDEFPQGIKCRRIALDDGVRPFAEAGCKDESGQCDYEHAVTVEPCGGAPTDLVVISADTIADCNLEPECADSSSGEESSICDEENDGRLRELRNMSLTKLRNSSVNTNLRKSVLIVNLVRSMQLEDGEASMETNSDGSPPCSSENTALDSANALSVSEPSNGTSDQRQEINGLISDGSKIRASDSTGNNIEVDLNENHGVSKLELLQLDGCCNGLLPETDVSGASSLCTDSNNHHHHVTTMLDLDSASSFHWSTRSYENDDCTASAGHGNWTDHPIIAPLKKFPTWPPHSSSHDGTSSYLTATVCSSVSCANGILMASSASSFDAPHLISMSCKDYEDHHTASGGGGSANSSLQRMPSIVRIREELLRSFYVQNVDHVGSPDYLSEHVESHHLCDAPAVSMVNPSSASLVASCGLTSALINGDGASVGGCGSVPGSLDWKQCAIRD